MIDRDRVSRGQLKREKYREKERVNSEYYKEREREREREMEGERYDHGPHPKLYLQRAYLVNNLTEREPREYSRLTLTRQLEWLAGCEWRTDTL